MIKMTKGLLTVKAKHLWPKGTPAVVKCPRGRCPPVATPLPVVPTPHHAPRLAQAARGPCLPSACWLRSGFAEMLSDIQATDSSQPSLTVYSFLLTEN